MELGHVLRRRHLYYWVLHELDIVISTRLLILLHIASNRPNLVIVEQADYEFDSADLCKVLNINGHISPIAFTITAGRHVFPWAH